MPLKKSLLKHHFFHGPIVLSMFRLLPQNQRYGPGGYLLLLYLSPPSFRHSGKRRYYARPMRGLCCVLFNTAYRTQRRVWIVCHALRLRRKKAPTSRKSPFFPSSAIQWPFLQRLMRSGNVIEITTNYPSNSRTGMYNLYSTLLNVYITSLEVYITSLEVYITSLEAQCDGKFCSKSKSYENWMRKML